MFICVGLLEYVLKNIKFLGCGLLMGVDIF